MSNAELAVSLVAIAALLLGGVVAFITSQNRQPRKADREYRASLRDVSASYSEEGVYGDVPFVPARPFADSEGGRRG
jgi:hypothetical protein